MDNHSDNEQINASAARNSIGIRVNQYGYYIPEKSELENGTVSQVEAVVDVSKDITNENSLNDTISDLQVTLGKYHSSNGPIMERGNLSKIGTEAETIQQYLEHTNSAAGIVCQMKTRHRTQGCQLPSIKGVLGIVALLGKVDDDNLSRQYVGDFVTDDPQKRLAIPKPKLPDGEIPHGFIDYAVNMINIDSKNLFYLTLDGQGLRETLFYHLFSHVQVYQTKEDMLKAVPCITNGALSLDGGMIMSTGVYVLGDVEEAEVTFPKASGPSCVTEDYYAIENQIKKTEWKKSKYF